MVIKTKRKRTKVETALLISATFLAIQLLHYTRKVLGKSFSKVLRGQKLKLLPLNANLGSTLRRYWIKQIAQTTKPDCLNNLWIRAWLVSDQTRYLKLVNINFIYFTKIKHFRNYETGTLFDQRISFCSRDAYFL